MAHEISGQPTPFLKSFQGLNQRTSANPIQQHLQTRFGNTPGAETAKNDAFVRTEQTPPVPTAPQKAPSFSPAQHQFAASSLLFNRGNGSQSFVPPSITPSPTVSAKLEGLQTADAIQHSAGSDNQGEGSSKQQK
jgi:hypothetical protein